MPFQTQAGKMGRLPSFHWIDSRQVALDSPLVYQGARQTFVVPRGFVSDFASVPKLFWWLFGPTGLYTAAAIVHDWFCKFGIQKRLISGRDADGMFRRMAEEAGVDPVLARLLWAGVRLGALVNPVRREDWWLDAPAVFGCAVLAVVPLLLATLGVLAGYLGIGVLRVLGWLARTCYGWIVR